ncbi:MAG: YdcF family protein [Bacillota bacterium]|nr:YdcF family protein [Bacillota bacterium]MDW7677411.1 YdcF family protein [Bacillota bacterium]
MGTFIIIQGLIMGAGHSTGNISATDILVPGAGIIRKEPSFTLAGRLNTAADYMHMHPESRVILTGGLADGQLASEAQVMAWYLEDHGIEPNRIILEEESSNTLENITYSMTLIKQTENRELDEVLIITSDYHLLRTQMIARRAGLKAAGIRSVSPSGLYKQYAVREFFAIFKSMFFDWPH